MYIVHGKMKNDYVINTYIKIRTVHRRAIVPHNYLSVSIYTFGSIVYLTRNPFNGRLVQMREFALYYFPQRVYSVI